MFIFLLSICPSYQLGYQLGGKIFFNLKYTEMLKHGNGNINIYPRSDLFLRWLAVNI